MIKNNNLLLEAKNLKTHFFLDEGIVRAVDNISFSIERGRTLGVVGESGCGKSVTGQSILGIVPVPGRVVEGDVLLHKYDQESGAKTETINMAKLDPRGKEIRAIRGKDIALIFQEPMTSFSPVHTIGDQVTEGVLLHQTKNKDEAYKIAVDMLKRCGLPRTDDVMKSYSWELSGGMRQRAMIAKALVSNPDLLIADEPTTALDVTMESQVLELMKDLQKELGMAVLYITHNLGVIAEMAEDVIVMYLGKIVEQADVETIFHNPKHPYTQALLQSIPKIGKERQNRLETIKGMVPNPYNIPPGCAFHDRCIHFKPGLCDQSEPKAINIGERHTVSCVLYK